MKKMFLIALSIFLISGTVVAEEPKPKMSLSATGSVQAEPDEGYITLGVQTKSETSAEAVRLNTQSMTAIYDALKEVGVDKKNVQTVEFTVQQSYKTIVEGNNRKSVPDGFVVQNMIRITVCELETFGDVLDKVTSSGANQVQSISFGSSESAKFLLQAREKACVEILEKAKTLTEGLGASLGNVISISESQPRSVMPVYAKMDFAAASESNEVPVSGGSLNFSVTISVTWALERRIFPVRADPRPFEKPDKPRRKGPN